MQSSKNEKPKKCLKMPKNEKQGLAVEALIESWSNPFVGNQDLNSISTAKEAPADMSYDLLYACEI